MDQESAFSIDSGHNRAHSVELARVFPVWHLSVGSQARIMYLDTLRTYCLAKPGVTEDLPFGPDTLVFKVQGKLFALTNVEWVESAVNLKCDPERAVELREQYAGIRPGYHMNKRHWNTVELRADVPGDLLRQLVDHSYDLVVAGLPKRLRDELTA